MSAIQLIKVATQRNPLKKRPGLDSFDWTAQATQVYVCNAISLHFKYYGVDLTFWKHQTCCLVRGRMRRELLVSSDPGPAKVTRPMWVDKTSRVWKRVYARIVNKFHLAEKMAKLEKFVHILFKKARTSYSVAFIWMVITFRISSRNHRVQHNKQQHS